MATAVVMPIVPAHLPGFLFWLLARHTACRDRIPYRWFWHRLYARSRRWTMPIATRLHGRRAVMNFNYAYPIFCRQFPELNAPLLELVQQAFLAAKRPIRLVDIGAAIGDTVLLVDANCPGAVSEYVCVDGDPEFFRFLQFNLSTFPNCRCLHYQLSSGRRAERALVRTHGGTASAQGQETVSALPLDEVLRSNGVDAVDVLKVDVDGFDGAVLAGATDTLRMHAPLAIFEWHPLLCRATGNDPFQAFEVLRATGYTQTVWFNKFGHFSHFSGTVVDEHVQRLREICERGKHEADWHYDIVALPANCRISAVALAELAHARRRLSPC